MKTLAQRVAAVLTDTSVTGLVDVYLSPIVVNSVQYKMVAEAILLGEIAVELTKDKKQQFSTYDNVANVLSLHTDDTGTLRTRAVILHEGVHAINDMNGQKSLVKETDEAAAYLASGMYLVRKKIDPYRAKGALKAGMLVAQDMISENRTWVTDAHTKYLIGEIRKDPLYSSDFATVMTYNGL